MTSTKKGIIATRPNGSEYSECSDGELLQLISENRDRAALTELYLRYKLPLGRFLQRQMGGNQLVDESYNDVMLSVWQKADQFKGNSKVSTWIFTIAYRSQLAHVKKESRHQHSDADDVMDIYTSQKQAETDNHTRISENLHAALSELSEDHRSVIELSYFHGYSTAEIADIVRCPQNTVKTRLFHARKKLKEALESDEPIVETRPEGDVLEITPRQQAILSHHDGLSRGARPERLH